jgi:hypothetical protein
MCYRSLWSYVTEIIIFTDERQFSLLITVEGKENFKNMSEDSEGVEQKMLPMRILGAKNVPCAVIMEQIDQ